MHCYRLDGATFELIDSLNKKGKLPPTKKLIEEGVYLGIRINNSTFNRPEIARRLIEYRAVGEKEKTKAKIRGLKKLGKI